MGIWTTYLCNSLKFFRLQCRVLDVCVLGFFFFFFGSSQFMTLYNWEYSVIMDWSVRFINQQRVHSDFLVRNWKAITSQALVRTPFTT